jgi:hypothetical protein
MQIRNYATAPSAAAGLAAALLLTACRAAEAACRRYRQHIGDQVLFFPSQKSAVTPMHKGG